MNLYDKSSLILVPSGVKASKVYSQRPENGDGDFTFTRASVANRINKDGLLEQVASNVPRLDYTDSSCPSLLLEPQRTNLLLQSNQFNTSWAALSSGSVTSGQSGIYGSNNAWELTSTSSGGNLYQGNSNSGIQTFSVYAKSDGSTGIRLYAFGSLNANAYFNLSTGVVLGASNTIASSIENVGNGWYRCSISFNQTNTGLRFYTSNNSTSLAAGSVYIQHAQLESGSYPTSVIETTTTQVTRNADITDRGANLSYTGDYTLFMEFELTKDAVYFLNSTAGSSYTMFFENDDTYFKFGRQSGDAANLYFVNRFDWAAALGTNIKFALVKDGTDAAMFVNGTKYTPSTNTLTTGNEILDWRYLSYSTTADRQEQAYIKQLLEFETALTDTELQNLTT